MRLTSSLQNSLFASLLLVLGGCNGSVAISAPEATPGLGPAPAPAPTTPVAKPPTKSISCGLGDSSDPARVVLAWVRGTDLLFTRADGSSFVAHAFPSAASTDPGSGPWFQLVTRGEFVAAIASSYSEGAIVSEALLLDSSGKVL